MVLQEQTCHNFSFAEIQSATNIFNDALIIGEGGYGKVYKGVIDLDGPVTVAIKRLNPTSKQGGAEFQTEIELLSKFRHCHIVSLVGYCDNSDAMAIVYEYMVHGTLADHLYRNIRNSVSLSWVQRLKICIGAARGLDYLHTGTGVQQKVIHRDVKSSNILLDENWAARVSDFGLSKIGPTNQDRTDVSTMVKGTPGYLDPEYYFTHRLTRKSDVYSFGVVLLEVLCGRPALDSKLRWEERNLARWGQCCIKDETVCQIIDPALKWEILPNSLATLVELADQCLHQRPKTRPTMSEVVVRLELALAFQERTDSSIIIEDDFFYVSGDYENQESPTGAQNYESNAQANIHPLPPESSAAQANVHPVSLPPGAAAVASQPAHSPQVTAKLELMPTKSQRQKTFYDDAIGVGLRSGDVSAPPQIVDSTLKTVFTPAQDGEKLSLIKLASLIEVSSKKGTRELNLQSKLMDQIEWLPDSIGKLSGLTTLDLSDNRIVALPPTIGGLSSLTNLDLHSNRISELPESVGDLLSLVCLDLRGNQLTSLSATFGRLVRLQELDLSSNHLSVLPDSIGSLVSLKKLNVETNDIEEIPHTINHCASLKELRADYNQLKALPEAVGRIGSLEILSARYNNISRLPTTMASLSSLRELNLSFNELESVPESLCFATTLVKLNISNNFADMQSLPRSIGNLEILEELDMSNNQIRVLPDSFRMLSSLRVLNVEGNPLEVPPRNVTEMGSQAVVQYMAELVAKRDVKSQPVKQKKTWAQICFFSRSNKRKRNGIDYVKA